MAGEDYEDDDSCLDNGFFEAMIRLITNYQINVNSEITLGARIYNRVG